MNYIFGTTNRDGGVWENVKTVGEVHTDLTGFCTVKNDYPDCSITDKFRVVRKYKSDEDSEGNCYDWYLIDCYHREIDKTGPLKEENEKLRADIDYLLMMEEE